MESMAPASSPFSLELGKELWGKSLNFDFQTVWLTSIPQRLPLAWLPGQRRPLTQLWFRPAGHGCALVVTPASVSWLSGQAVSQVRSKFGLQNRVPAGNTPWSAGIVRRQHPKRASHHACSPSLWIWQFPSWIFSSVGLGEFYYNRVRFL